MERARDRNRNEFGRKKRKSDSGAAMKARNDRRKEKDEQSISGNLRFYVRSDDEKVQIFDLIDRATLMMSETVSLVNNAMILREVFNFYLDNNSGARNEMFDEGDDEINFAHISLVQRKIALNRCVLLRNHRSKILLLA